MKNVKKILFALGFLAIVSLNFFIVIKSNNVLSGNTNISILEKSFANGEEPVYVCEWIEGQEYTYGPYYDSFYETKVIEWWQQDDCHDTGNDENCEAEYNWKLYNILGTVLDSEQQTTTFDCEL